MNCREYQEATSLLIDGAATDDRMRDAFLHLHECEECRSFFRTALEIRSTLGAARDDIVPARLDERVLAIPLKTSARKSVPRFSFSSQWRERIAVPKLAVAFAAVVVVLASAITIWFSLRLTQNLPAQKIVYVVGLEPVEVQGTYNVASSQ
ncbi:MAG: zf-HC2 domain-containing protein [Ignavibacteriae bacterium]|nr:zf-HC2 domain-containing protein [Ignavibacteriota bacterium]